MIFKYQGEKLNQVREHSLNYLRDDAALRRLVVEPCKRYLEYSDAAVNVIRDYSAGNPYYATHICARVYEDMYMRRDHYVAEGDVLRSVDRICEGSGVNDFQHLWTDGVFEGGAETAEMQYLNALVEVACARAGEADDDLGAVGREWLMDQDDLRTYDPAIVRHRLDNLIHRGVLVQQGDTGIRLRVPLFRRWLRKGGEAAVRASFGGKDLRMRFMPIEVGPAARDVVEVAEGLVYQGQPVGVDRVRAWLEQFGFDGNQKLAFAVLKRLKQSGYFNDARIHQSCKTLHQIMLQEFASKSEFAQMIEKGRTRNLFFTSFDDEAKSGGPILYGYRTANDLPRPQTGRLEEAVGFVLEQKRRGRRCAVCFVDDFIATGGSCSAGLNRFRDALRAEGGDLEDVVIGVVAVAGFASGVEAVRNWEGGCSVRTAVELGGEHMAFSPEAGIFDTEQERKAAKKLFADIGGVLEPRQPLGYEGCEALVAFEHRCPNNTLPVFYKHGVDYRGRRWIALFPR